VKIDEPRPGHLHARDVTADGPEIGTTARGFDGVDQSLGQVLRFHADLLGEHERGIGREVAMRRVLGTLDADRAVTDLHLLQGADDEMLELGFHSVVQKSIALGERVLIGGSGALSRALPDARDSITIEHPVAEDEVESVPLRLRDQ
jgi:hypothetical protein